MALPLATPPARKPLVSPVVSKPATLAPTTKDKCKKLRADFEKGDSRALLFLLDEIIKRLP